MELFCTGPMVQALMLHNALLTAARVRSSDQFCPGTLPASGLCGSGQWKNWKHLCTGVKLQGGGGGEVTASCIPSSSVHVLFIRDKPRKASRCSRIVFSPDKTPPIQKTSKNSSVISIVMAKQLVLVTGGSGYIGSYCIVKLLQAGYRVRTTVRSLKREADVRAMVKAGGAVPGE